VELAVDVVRGESLAVMGEVVLLSLGWVAGCVAASDLVQLRTICREFSSSTSRKSGRSSVVGTRRLILSGPLEA
jgi:hypothetical protein